MPHLSGPMAAALPAAVPGWCRIPARRAPQPRKVAGGIHARVRILCSQAIACLKRVGAVSAEQKYTTTASPPAAPTAVHVGADTVIMHASVCFPHVQAEMPLPAIQTTWSGSAHPLEGTAAGSVGGVAPELGRSCGEGRHSCKDGAARQEAEG